MKVCLAHRCWNHPEDNALTCPVYAWETEVTGSSLACDWQEMQLVPADAELQCPNCKFVYEVAR